MKTSLIITTYNSPELLLKVLGSILVQTRPPDEVIIADDGSGEETGGLVKDFSGTAPFPVFHVWQENKGFRAAKIRNEAIKRSSGDYIILLDGDCAVNRHFVADHLLLAEDGYFIQGKRVHVNRDAISSFDSACTNSLRELTKMALTGRISNIHHLIRLHNVGLFRNRSLKKVKSCNMSFFRKDILAVNGFNEDFVGWGNEDSELAYRFFKYGLVKKVHLFMAICFHMWHQSNKFPDNNKQILLETMLKDEYFCANGIIKKG